MRLKTSPIVALLIVIFTGTGYLLIDRARDRQDTSQAETDEIPIQLPEVPEVNAAGDEGTSSPSNDEKKPRPAESPSKKTQVSGRKTSQSQTATPPQPSRKRDGQENQAVPAAPRVLVYYFHGTQRCATCRKLEAFSLEAVQQGFQEALQQGQLEWRLINVDEPDNAHFVDEYQLFTRSLVIVKMSDGEQTEWKNLHKIWELVGNKSAFISYVQDEIDTYMGDES